MHTSFWDFVEDNALELGQWKFLLCRLFSFTGLSDPSGNPEHQFIHLHGDTEQLDSASLSQDRAG